MKFSYTLKDGTVINDLMEIRDIRDYYNAACTAEYIEDLCGNVLNDEQTLKLGYEVRRRMSKVEYSDETETTENVLIDFKEKVIDWIGEHVQAGKDFSEHFGVEYSEESECFTDDTSDLDIEDVLNWIAEHKTLKADFDLAFERFV